MLSADRNGWLHLPFITVVNFPTWFTGRVLQAYLFGDEQPIPSFASLLPVLVTTQFSLLVYSNQLLLSPFLRNSTRPLYSSPVGSYKPFTISIFGPVAPVMRTTPPHVAIESLVWS